MQPSFDALRPTQQDYDRYWLQPSTFLHDQSETYAWTFLCLLGVHICMHTHHVDVFSLHCCSFPDSGSGTDFSPCSMYAFADLAGHGSRVGVQPCVGNLHRLCDSHEVRETVASLAQLLESGWIRFRITNDQRGSGTARNSNAAEKLTVLVVPRSQHPLLRVCSPWRSV